MEDHNNEWITRVICDKLLVSLKFLGFMPNALIPLCRFRRRTPNLCLSFCPPMHLRIQDLALGGGGHQPPTCALFSENLCERIGPR